MSNDHGMLPPPVPPPPGPPSTTIVTSPSADPPKTPWWRKWWVIAIAVVAVLVGIGAAVGGKSDDTTRATETTEAPSPDTSTGPSSSIAVDTTSATETSSDPETTEAQPTTPPTNGNEIDGAPAGLRGTRDNPVPAGQLADVGDGWRLQVLAVVDDATTLIMDRNEFNDPPPAGSRFSMVTVALGYFGLEDPTSGFEIRIAAVGAASVELDGYGCGVVPDELNLTDDLFAGGTRSGNVCFVTTPADTGVLQLYASTLFGDDDVYLDAGASPAGAVPMATIRGPQARATSTELRQTPSAIGTGVDAGDGWTATITGPAVDVTDAVLAENQFNEPPPSGFRFVGVPVEYRYDGPDKQTPLMLTIRLVGDSNSQFSRDCGVVPGEIDGYSDVFTGGSVAGLLCFVVPEVDRGTETAYVAAGFASDTYAFLATK